MKLRYPAYYEKFSCIAGECEDTCCAGWEIDIDEKSYEYYQSLPGQMGEKIRSRIKEYALEEEDTYECHGFILEENRRCPFLNERNLCDIILALGEDAICDVCTDTPRNFFEYGGVREISVSPSCAEAGRLIFHSPEKVSFIEKEQEGELELEETEEEFQVAEAIRLARDGAIYILQNRSISIYDRMVRFLQYGKRIQDSLNSEDLEAVAEIAGKILEGQEFLWQDKEMHREQTAEEKRGGGSSFCHRDYAYFTKRFASFSGLDSINEEWENYLQSMNSTFVENETGFEKYREAFLSFDCYLRENDREYEYEQWGVYLAFLMLARAVDDWNFWGKVQYVAASFLFVRDMDILRYYLTGKYTIEDRVDIVRIYTKEVEHSQENLDYLEEEFLFEELYHFQKLTEQITLRHL